MLYPPHNPSPSQNHPPTLNTKVSSETINNIDRIIVSNIKIFLSTTKKKGGAKKTSCSQAKDAILTACVFGLSEGTKKDEIRAAIGVSKSSFYKSVNKDKKYVPAEEYKAPVRKQRVSKIGLIQEDA